MSVASQTVSSLAFLPSASRARTSELTPKRLRDDRCPALPGAARRGENFEELLLAALPAARNSVEYILRYHYSNDVEDVMQDAAVKAWTHFATFQHRAKFSSWFYRIAVNQALMLLRSKERELLSLEDVATLLSPIISLESCVIAKERNAQLRRAIVMLSEARRQEILRYSQAERHDPLNMLARNKSARFYARHALRSALLSTRVRCL